MYRLSLPAALMLCLAACTPPSAPPAPEVASHERLSDSLLSRPALQALVDAQVAREAAPLIEALSSEHADVRARAAFALGSVQAGEALPGLLRLLNDPEPAVRADAAFALGQLSPMLHAEILLNRMEQEEDAGVLFALVEAIGKTGDAAALRRLLDPTLPAALEAARALAVGRFGLRGIHDTTAVRYLLQHLNAPDGRLRQNAAYYFGRMADPAPWRFAADSVRHALRLLRPTDPATMHLTLGLGRLEETIDLPLFITRLESAPDWRTRVNSARALTAFASLSTAQDALLDALDDPSTHVGIQAARGLAAADSVTEALARTIAQWLDVHTNDWRVGGELLPLLVRYGDLETVQSWQARHETNPQARALALTALGATDEPESLSTLLSAARDSVPAVASAALGALAARWDRDTLGTDRRRYYDTFAHALRTRDLAAIYTAAPALADPRFRADSAIVLMEEVYRQLATPQDVEAMTAILDALGATQDREAAPLLREAAAHPHPVVRQHAARAYERITGETLPQLAQNETSEQQVDWAFLQSFGSRPVLVLDTDKGAIHLELDAEQAPLTVQTILQLAEAGRFDNVPFHRVVPNFVIQGGDFARGDGFGGPGFSIRSEFTRIPYLTGTVGMASAGKDTEGSQFFITHAPQPHLDGKYTAFGTVVAGQDVVDRIYSFDRIRTARVVRS